MGLDAEVFWTAFEKRFEKRVTPKKQQLFLDYKIGTVEETPELKLKYDLALRELELVDKRLAYDLKKFVLAFTVKEMTQSLENPNEKFLESDVKVNRPLLSKMYYSLTGEGPSKNEVVLYIFPDIELKDGLVYADFQVFDVIKMREDIAKNWQNWLNDNRPEKITRIEVADEALWRKFQDYLSFSADDIKNKLPFEFKNAYFMKVSSQLSATQVKREMLEFTISYNGGINIIDFKTGRSVFNENFSNDIIKYSNSSALEFGSKIVNHIYRMPMASFQKIPKNLGTDLAQKDFFEISFINYGNLEKVHDFIEQLKTQGNALNIQTKMVGFKSNAVDFEFEISGSKSDLLSLLNTLKAGGKNAPRFHIVDLGKGIGIKFNKMANKAK